MTKKPIKNSHLPDIRSAHCSCFQKRSRASKTFYCFILTLLLFQSPLLKAETPSSPSNDFSNDSFFDSSLQRSQFFPAKPNYEKKIEDQLFNRRSLFLWKLRFDSQSLETQQNIHSRNVGGTLLSKFRYRIMDQLDFKARANLNLEAGRYQDLFGDLEPGSGVYPREIKIQWRLFGDSTSLNFGQINQSWFNEGLFLGRLGFPGFSQRWGYKFRGYNIDFIGQQLIPTSSTLSTRVAQKEQIPYLFTESLQAYFKPTENNFLKARITHYKYTRLPAIVAFESFVYGNTVAAPDRNNSVFKYGFDGFLTQLLFEQKLGSDFSAQIQWSTIKNMMAPNNLGEAQSVKLSFGKEFRNWFIIGSLTNYFIEPDAVPAFYNSYRLGHNNRIGDSYQLIFESKKWGVNFLIHYTKANLLNSTVQRVDGLQQDNQQTFYFKMETLYEFI